MTANSPKKRGDGITVDRGVFRCHIDLELPPGIFVEHMLVLNVARAISDAFEQSTFAEFKRRARGVTPKPKKSARKPLRKGRRT